MIHQVLRGLPLKLDATISILCTFQEAGFNGDDFQRATLPPVCGVQISLLRFKLINYAQICRPM